MNVCIFEILFIIVVVVTKETFFHQPHDCVSSNDKTSNTAQLDKFHFIELGKLNRCKHESATKKNDVIDFY